MRHIHRALKPLAAAALLAAAAGSAQAIVAVDQRFEFFGTCSDCTLNAAPGDAIATLVLTSGYVLGAPITVNDIISFSYVGSNLVDPYTVTGGGAGGFAEIYLASGAMTAGTGGKDFRIDFIDGLAFQTAASGEWATCARGPGGFYSGSCNLLFNNNDFGMGSWNAPAVPEPGTWALMGLGVAALVARRRRAA